MAVDPEPMAAAVLHELAAALAGHPVPRVMALHLPDRRAAAGKDGEFGALMLDSGAIGLSYVLLDHTLAALRPAPPAWPGRTR